MCEQTLCFCLSSLAENLSTHSTHASEHFRLNVTVDSYGKAAKHTHTNNTLAIYLANQSRKIPHLSITLSQTAVENA